MTLEEITPQIALDAMNGVLLFHSGSPWDAAKQEEWRHLTTCVLGEPKEATTRTMCDMIRVALGKKEAK